MRVMLQITEDGKPHKAKWIYTGLAYAALLFAVTWAMIQPEITPRPELTLVLGVAAAVWLGAIVRWWPVWPRQRAWAVVAYLGLLALNVGLIASSDAFTAYVWIGFPYAFAIFPARWAVFAVTSNAVSTFVVQSGALQSSPFVVMVGVAGPVIFAGWVAGLESERREKAISQLTEANRRLASAMEENAGLHAQLLVQAREAGVLDERQRMAREIHDTLAQELAALIRQLHAANRVREQPEQWQHHMDQVRLMAERGLSEARRSVQALRPAQLEKSRLPEAIEELARNWSQASGVPVRVETTGTPEPMIPGIEVALFRVVQEALANIANHASAARAGITLSYSDDVVLLDVRDDGAGFDPGATGPGEDGGYGLGTMRQRLLGVGGTLEIESRPGEGTAIGASVPAIRAEGAP
ncbi:sensor histidine kinase [Kibdelosporangium persicum]|uniref:Integral membrane sensor signal transduction histidine kinase n=1 Tax=Kibdelosporangium persicum TaxID=2698649 RepID=A0ABX2F5E9_9PSEU|nr:sensor histidine kinase [Kibdelosporangium persicum]NRN66058.1 Integral membrane sensor signal transduction histidine kinase [Kibdelosporangium persicum]